MTRGPGFFISPKGEIIQIETTHIRTVRQDPELFGLSRPWIESTHKKHTEKSGLEGNAREEILRKVLKNGWVRLRRHTNRYWSVQTGTVTGETKSFIRRWAQEILRGTCSYREVDPYMLIKIEGLEDGFRQDSRVQDIAEISYTERRGEQEDYQQWHKLGGKP